MSSAPLGVVVQSGAVDRVHYALLFAAGAAAVGRPVHLFFTMAGCRVFEGLEALLPAGDGTAATEYAAALGEKRIAGFAELWESLEVLGVNFSACDTGLAAAAVAAPSGVEVTGVVGFLRAVGSEAQLIYV